MEKPILEQSKLHLERGRNGFTDVTWYFEQQKKIGSISQVKPTWPKLYAGLLNQPVYVDHILTWEDIKDKLAFRNISQIRVDSSF